MNTQTAVVHLDGFDGDRGRTADSPAAGTKVFVVVRFDPAQCGACGNGKLDKIFWTLAEAEAYVRCKASGRRRGGSWEIREGLVESYPVEEEAVA